MDVCLCLRDARDNWRWMVGLPVFPASAMLLGIFILPESPRWGGAMQLQAE